MALTPRLELRQSQQLLMTPQLRQSIQMLQMSTLELSGYLGDLIERNPLISLSDATGSAARPAPAPGERAAVDADIRRADLHAGEAQFETGRENLYEGAEPGPGFSGGRGGRSDFESLGSDGAASLAQPVSLAGHVAQQLALIRMTPAERVVAEALAGEIDDAGYLRADLAATAARLGVPVAVAERAAAAIRTCEPTGVGARDLAECLALQLAERDRLDPAMQALLANLAQLPTTPAATLAAACGVDREDLDDMLAELRRLDPRPGLAIGGGVATPVIPDVIVRPDRTGGWAVRLNAEALPKLLIDRAYAARVGAAGDRETRLFISECAQNAHWLKRSLDQRARTILKVSAEIVRLQRGFLDHGVGALRPMTLADVAGAVGVHESTVSRVSARKYLATPRGLFELKFFFTTAIAAADGGEAHSAKAVRDRIRALVAAEPPGKPLSDDRLVAVLRAEGIDLARRTVAKYREGLNIPSSVARRRRALSAI